MDQDQPLFTVVTNRAERIAAKLDPCLDAISRIAPGYLTPEELLAKPRSPHEILIVDFLSIASQIDIASHTSFYANPILGLLPRREVASPTTRTLCCTEIVAWPGHSGELKVKLQRLARMLTLGERIKRSLTLKQTLIGKSELFLRVLDDIRKYSRCDAPVLILGETGTGKEQIARAIHYVGIDSNRPFIAVNCGALPDSLVENELFGHARGAYTDAHRSQPGLIEQANGGTLFLDEIEVLSQKGQIALLRLLQESEYRPLGAQETKKVHLRLIASSNEPLERLVDEGVFRRDLYYRINILALNLPPLRERFGDVLLLAEHFIDKYREKYVQFDKYIDPETMEWMKQYSWPGNVRELENLLLREFLLADSACIAIRPRADFMKERRGSVVDRRQQRLFKGSFQDAKSAVIKNFERNYLIYVLEDAKGNISQAARLAGKERRTFVRLLEKNGLIK